MEKKIIEPRLPAGGDSRKRMSAFVTCTVDKKLSPKPRYSSTSDEIFTSVEKVVQGRGQSDESDPRYKFSSFPENKMLQLSNFFF